jgi:hypothetical protein
VTINSRSSETTRGSPQNRAGHSTALGSAFNDAIEAKTKKLPSNEKLPIQAPISRKVSNQIGRKKTELKIYKARNRKIRAIENPLTVVQKRMHTRTLSLSLSLSLSLAHRSYPDSLSLKNRNITHLGVLEKKGRGKKNREREDEAAADRRWF